MEPIAEERSNTEDFHRGFDQRAMVSAINSSMSWRAAVVCLRPVLGSLDESAQVFDERTPIENASSIGAL